MIFKGEFFGTFQLGLFNWWMIIIVFILGLLLFFDKKIRIQHKLFIAFLYMFPIMLFIVLMGYHNDLWGWWVLELHVIGCMLFGSIIGFFWIKRNIILRVLIAIVLCLFALQYVKSTIRFWKYDYPDYGGVAKIQGKIDALDYIYRDAKTKDFGLFFFTPPVYTYAYDYINWWHGNRVYGYVAPQEKKSTFYLLAEPDPEKPWTYKGWMETAIVGGDIVETKTLSSGFIVQKRILK